MSKCTCAAGVCYRHHKRLDDPTSRAIYRALDEGRLPTLEEVMEAQK